MKNYFFALISLAIISSCSNDRETENPTETKLKAFAGDYKIVSITSKEAVDLNYDGKFSQNYLQELFDTGYLNQKQLDHVYIANAKFKNFNKDSSFNPFEFNFPVQTLAKTGNYDGQYVMGYWPKFYTFKYLIDNQNNITVKDYNEDYNNQFGKVTKFTNLGKNGFIAELTVKNLNEKTNTYYNVDLEVAYKKIK